MAALLSCTLASLLLLAYSAPAPELSIPDVLACEEGTEVTVAGILVDYWLYDGGAEALILAEITSSARLKIVVTRGIASMPSSYATIGDELEASGEVSSSRGVAFLLASGDDVKVVRESEDAISVRTISEHWMLFEGDSVQITGVLIWDGITLNHRIQDPDGCCSILIQPSKAIYDQLLGMEVLLAGIVGFCVETASVVFSVQDVTVR